MTTPSSPSPRPASERGAGSEDGGGPRVAGPRVGGPRPASARDAGRGAGNVPGRGPGEPTQPPVIGRRGSYSKGRARRTEILDRALEVLQERGAQGTSLRRVAEAIGVSHAALLHYFSSREQLLLAVHQHAELRKREVLAARASQGGAADEPASPAEESASPAGGPASPVEELVAAATWNVRVPGMVQLYSMLLGMSLEEPPGEATEYIAQRFQGLRTLWAGQIAEQQEKGSLRRDVDAEQMASLLIAASDGLQIQWLLDPSVDLEETLAVFEKLLRA